VHTIGTRLKAWREAKSLKQAEASQQLGLAASQQLGLAGNTYQNYERDVRAPNTEGRSRGRASTPIGC